MHSPKCGFHGFPKLEKTVLNFGVYMAAKRIWPDQALKILKDNHAAKSNQEVADMLIDYGFTEKMVANKASRLGLKKNKTLVALRISTRVKKTEKANQIMSGLIELGNHVKFKPFPPEPVFKEETDEEYYDSLMDGNVKNDDDGVLKNIGKRY